MVYSYNVMKINTAMKINKLLLHARTWINLTNKVLSEREKSQRKKIQYNSLHIFSLNYRWKFPFSSAHMIYFAINIKKETGTKINKTKRRRMRTEEQEEKEENQRHRAL